MVMTVGAARFVPNPAGIALLTASPAVQATLEAIATQIAEAAKALAPVRTGAYRDSIEVQDGDVPGTKMVVATDWKSNWIEFGTIYMSALAPLRLGADSAGVVLRGGKGGT